MLYVNGKRIAKNYPTGTWCNCSLCKRAVEYFENNHKNFNVIDYAKALKGRKPCLSLNGNITKQKYSSIVRKLKNIYKKSYKSTLCFKEFT